MLKESIRIPLFIDFSGISGAGKISDAMVLNIDFVPTIRAAAGIPVPDELNGRALQPMTNGALPDWRDHFLSLSARQNMHPALYYAREAIRTL